MGAYSTALVTDLCDQRLDAIVVPTNRSGKHLTYALELAKATNAFLLVLCSGSARVTDVTNRIVSHGVRGLAAEVPINYQHPLFLNFETNGFSAAMLGRAANDISLKRNLGLIVGRMAGWRNLLFLDDDIANIKELDQAIDLATKEPVAGFLVGEFPDNSVVRHAERLIGVEPGVRLTGSALMINFAAVTAFFPHIYNEDWFFLSGISRGAFCSTLAGTANQIPYNPFAEPSRAVSEEFGDLLAEGILQLTDTGRDCIQSTESDWRDLITNRKLLIRRIRKELKACDFGYHDVLNSLAAAEARLNDIVPQACVAYIAAWSRDLDLFRVRFALLQRQEASVEHIVETMGLKSAQSALTEYKYVF